MMTEVQIEYDREEGWFSANVATGAGGTIVDDEGNPIMDASARGYAKAIAAHLSRWPDDIVVEDH